MAKRPMRSQEERLLAAEVAINGALAEGDILAALTPFGYGEARLQEARGLYEEGQRLANQQRREYGEQEGATQRLMAAWEEADAAYRLALKVARVAFKGSNTAETALLLAGRRRESLSGWLEQAMAFYDNLLGSPDLLARMATFGYTAPKVAGEGALVRAVYDANRTQEREKGEAQDATKRRDATLDELDEWVADFKEIAEAALASSPQWLEKLGFGPVR